MPKIQSQKRILNNSEFDVYLNQQNRSNSIDKNAINSQNNFINITIKNDGGGGGGGHHTLQNQSCQNLHDLIDPEKSLNDLNTPY